MVTAKRFGRRHFLAATATVVGTALAGCGYRPGGGEFDWRVEFRDHSMLGGSTDETWRTDGQSLFRIRNRSGRTINTDDSEAGFVEVSDARVTAYDAAGERRWTESAPRQYVGDPAVDDGRVYLSLEDGGVTALEGPDDESTADPSGSDGNERDLTPRWTTDWEGPPLSLRAAGTVVGVHRDGLVGFDADDGTERFALEDERFAANAIVDVALATDRVWVLGDGGPEPGTGEPVLYGIAADGAVETTNSLPDDSFWVESIGSDALVGVDEEIRAIAADGAERFAVDLEGPAGDTPIPVADADRCYRYSSDAIEAIDASDGTVVWRREDPSFDRVLAADGDGIYGRRWADERGVCELTAVTNDGDRWWTAPTLEELGCSGDYFLVDDRIVVVTSEELYGFRKAPAEGLTVL